MRKAKGVVPRAVSDEEICERLFYPLINEGFKILEQGYVARSSDIDLVCAQNRCHAPFLLRS